MSDPGDELSRRYRELARDEPPPAIDAAILTAATRATGARPMRRWAGPVSIAAVLVLGIGVSLRMQREQPGIEIAPPSAPAPAVAPAAPEMPAAPASAETYTPAKPPARAKLAPPRPQPQPQSQAQPQPRPFADSLDAAAPVQKPAAAPPPAAMSAPAPAPAGPMLKYMAGTEAAELDRIGRLRAEGRHDEADKALEDFKRRHPSYAIPDDVWQRVKPR